MKTDQTKLYNYNTSYKRQPIMSKRKDIKHVDTNQFILLTKPTLVEFQMEEPETISNDKFHRILILQNGK